MRLNHLESSKRRRRANADEGGFVLPWFALMLIVLVAMAGFGVDVWNWWYTGQQEQRAADAAALAGVPFMPGNFNTTAPSAVSTAIDAAARNGYTITAANVSPGPKSNQLIVTIGNSVTNSFTSLLGSKTTNISRSATAEFNEPVQMGSPAPYIGCDPENSCTAKHWLNIGAPHVDKVTGDRYADYGGTGGCTASYQCAGNNNGEYNQNSYAYTIEVAAAGVGSNIDIQVYDPEYANGGTSCDQNWGNGTDGQPPQGLTAIYSDAATRYKTGTSTANDYCPGDDNTALGTPQATVWMVRGIDGTPDDYSNNPIIQTGGPGTGGHCTKQFKGYDGTPFSDLLDGTAANTTNPPKFDQDFADSFHRWYTMCNIPGTGVGKYFIQVRSNVPLQATPSDANLLKDETTPEDNNIGGQNRYAIRAVTHNTTNIAPNVQIYAATHLPVYANTGTNGASPNFYLARLLPGGGATGRKLQLKFFDIGDVGCVSGGAAGCGVSTVAITSPADMTLANGDAISCAWTKNGGAALTNGTITGCTLSNIQSANFNGVLVEVDISVPGSYNCNYGDVNGCWFRLQMSYTNGTQANDTTTWDASIGGDPVRLIK